MTQKGYLIADRVLRPALEIVGVAGGAVLVLIEAPELGVARGGDPGDDRLDGLGR